MNNKLLFLIIFIVLLLTGCTKKPNHITLAYVDWDESIAMTYVAQEIFETQGYTTQLVNTTIESVFDSIVSQQADVFMNVWLPITHKKYIQENNELLESLGHNFEHGKIGLAVPQYVPLTYITELNQYSKTFNSKIIGVEYGTGIMLASENAIKAYALTNFSLEYNDEATLFTALKDSISKEKWILITAWKPHWMFKQYNLKFLKDPLSIYGLTEIIQTYAWKGFTDENEFAAKLLGNIYFNEDEINDLLLTFHAHSNKKEAAKIWIKKHQKLVNNWIPKKLKPRTIF